MGIEAALLGSTLASSTAGASTVGLLGAGGVFAPTAGSLAGALSGIGGLSTLSGGLSILSGVQQQQAASEQASIAREQASLEAAEAGRIAGKQAFQMEQEADDVRRRQKLAFLKSGVSLEGSPLLIMEETRQKGLENVQEIIKAGGASGASALTEGRIRAQNFKSAGRQSLIKGLVQGGRTTTGYF